MTTQRKDRLGRGLGALLGDYLAEEETEAEVRRVAVSAISPNPYQPRRDFPDPELQDLASSIRENGLLQPLVVRPAPGGGPRRFQLVAGERRLRAVRSLDWKDVQVFIRDVDDRTLLVLAMVENLQREALGPLEEAEGYQVLGEEFGLTQEEIGHSVGKDRSTVSNMLRLLKLPPSVRRLLADGVLSVGHARALLGVTDPVRAGDLGRRAAAEGWTVREVERRVRDPGGAGGRRPRRPAANPGDPSMRALEEELRRVLGTRVVLRSGRGGRGKIEIPYHGVEDLERLFALVARREAAEILE